MFTKLASLLAALALAYSLKSDQVLTTDEEGRLHLLDSTAVSFNNLACLERMYLQLPLDASCDMENGLTAGIQNLGGRLSFQSRH